MPHTVGMYTMQPAPKRTQPRVWPHLEKKPKRRPPTLLAMTLGRDTVSARASSLIMKMRLAVEHAHMSQRTA
jgi:hypothetical protein